MPQFVKVACKGIILESLDATAVMLDDDTGELI
jgi:hypothetical protein